MIDEIRHVQIEDLIPYARNARTHSDEQVAQIAASIREFGFVNPVLLRCDNTIIAGHGRVMAARKLGLDTVPAVYLSHLTDTQAMAYVIADNNLALNAGWDEELLNLELEYLADEGFDLDLTGFSSGEIEELAGGDGVEVVEDEVPEPPEDPITKPGDLWLLGEHRLLCGDSSDPRDIERLTGGDEWQVTVLDPPYELADNLWAKWIADPCILFGQMRHLLMVPRKLWRFERIIVKKYRHRSATVQIDHRHAFVAQLGTTKTLPGTSETFPSVIEQELAREHDHAKPLSLLVEHLTKWTPLWSIVIDPYLGSGTTLIAAEQLGRKCYGMEISPQYCDVIVKRWETLTGKKAERENA